MKTAVSIPEPIFREADRLARRLKKSRSELYARAIAEYVARHDPDAVTEAMNRVCEAVDSRPDPLVRAAGRRVLEQSDW